MIDYVVYVVLDIIFVRADAIVLSLFLHSAAAPVEIFLIYGLTMFICWTEHQLRHLQLTSSMFNGA